MSATSPARLGFLNVMVLLLSAGCGLSRRRSAGFAGAIGRGASKVENERRAVPDRAQRISGNFHRLPPEVLGPARCKFGRSKPKLAARSLEPPRANPPPLNQPPCQPCAPPPAPRL